MAGRMPPQNQTPQNPIGLLPKRPGFDIMHNCDLHLLPPVNVFPGNEMKPVLQSKTRDGDERDEIMKALRLSQTRAREAERRAAVLTKERDIMANALLRESSRLFAYRQWVKLLEVQVSLLQRQYQGPVKKGNDDDNEGGGGCMVWFVALALCFGLASLGFFIGG